jgi:alpha-galactosidase
MLHIQELSRFTFADIIAIYSIHVELGRVQLQLIPKSLERKIPKHRAFLDDPDDPALRMHEPKQAWGLDSLVQLRLADDSMVGAYGNGRTMRNSEATLGLKFHHQRATKHKVLTVLKHPRRFRCEHILEWVEGEQALRMSSRFINSSAEPLTLEMLASFSLGGITPFACDEAPGRLRLHRIRSAWSAEGRLDSTSLEQLHMEPSWAVHGVTGERFGQVGSMPSRGFFPFAAIEDTGPGVTWAAQIAWNGSWQMEAYRRDDFVQLSGGLADREFGHWWKTVASGESFITPTALVTVVAGSVDNACQRLTSSYRRSAPRGEDELPIVFNEWCTTWGHPNHDNVIALADRLAGSQVQYLVIDDGWAERPAERMQENGDWIVATKKFPHGLRATCDAIRERGLIPGIWFEFEVANKGSKAWNEIAHQLHRDARVINVGSRRFWDFRDPWVHDFLAERVIELLRHSGMGYMKVDYNETIGLGCDGAESPGEGLRQHLEGVRSFFQRIRRELPGLVIEICSSGGMRLEPSMLELGAMASFSDAHETRDIPILAYNLQRMIPARASQIWAVIRSGDTPQRLVYSLASTFLGRMCISGEVDNLSASQWAKALEAQQLYRQVSPIIADGISHRTGPEQTSYRHPSGWQAVLRVARNGKQALAVVHTFAEAPQKPIVVALSDGKWRIAGALRAGKKSPAVRGNRLIIPATGDYQGCVVHLIRSSMSKAKI